jgi:two-component system, OmpR family, catabolic regulation response regulator CreB
MQLAWEEPERSLERTVDSHMKTLRQKLKAICSSEEAIVTHRGFGYALQEAP